MKKKTGPNMGKWKQFRYDLMTENTNVQEDTEVIPFKHEGNYISTRDLYEYIKENGLFNKDLEVEVVDIEKKWEPGEEGRYTIHGFKINKGKLEIEVS